MKKYPLISFFVIAIGLTWAIQITFLVLGWELTPAKLAELAILLGAAVLVTARSGGRPAVRQLLAGVLRWRIGVGRYLLVIGAMPVLTLLVAAATGTFRSPPGGWLAMIGTYLFLTIVFGALLGNVWEETAWAGFVQRRLMDRHGLLVGPLLTAIPFALIHLPLAFESGGLRGTSWRDAGITWAALIVTAPLARYLVGMVFVDTAGSLLAVGLLHASWNASGALAATGDWQFIPAIAILTLLVAGYRALRAPAPAVALR